MNAFIFVPLLVLAWMFGLAFAAHASHYFLTVVESSATAMARNLSWTGKPFREWIRDGVSWPDDLFVDYFAKTFYFAYIIGIYAGPAVLLGRLLTDDAAWTLIIAGTAFWLFFPIGVLSSLASESRWNPFWPGLIHAFLLRPVKTFAFYLLSAPVLAVVFITFDFILVHTSRVTTVWAIALSPFAVCCFFIYARLLGRLGMVVSFTRPEIEREPKPRRRTPRRPINAYDPRTRPFMPKEEVHDEPPLNVQPHDLTAIETPEGAVTGYGVDFDGTAEVIEEVKSARIIHKFDDEDDSPITVEKVHDIANTDRARIAAEMAKPPERELALYLRERPKEPTNPFGAEAITFLFNLKTIDPWLRLTLGLIGMTLLQRALDGLRPE